jgi:uncharacterized protein YndB with AHSA1/START domain
MQKEIKHTWHFARSPEEVWEYLTKPELIEQWLMKTDFQPKVGHQFRFIHAVENKSCYDSITHCEVLEVKPFTTLSYSWKGSTNDGNRTFDSKVVWTLIPTEGGTELQLVHNGFTVLEDVLAHDTGWTALVIRFVELVNTSKEMTAQNS